LKAEVISTGAEFLLGASLDTNGPWLARELAALGFQVDSLRLVGDQERDLEEAFQGALQRHDLVIVTGGLGPTVDDLTRKVVAKVTGRSLVYREELARGIEDFFKQRNWPCPKANLNQAFSPQGSLGIPNPLGTAPGFIVKTGKSHLAVMPGVPPEMKAMFEATLKPYLKSLGLGGSVVKSRVYRTTGMGECQLNEAIRDIFEKSQNPSVAVTVHPEGVDVRLTARAENDEKADVLLEALGKTVLARLPNHVYGMNEDGLEVIVGRLLKMRNISLALAESCTGGGIASRVTAVPGSSDYFRRGYVVYSNAAKSDLLQVEPTVLASRGAVSVEVAEQLARNCRKNAGVNLALSVTGIAGPAGGTPSKPVGLVFMGLADEAGVRVFEYRFSGDRETIRRRAIQAALELLRRYCLSLPLKD